MSSKIKDAYLALFPVDMGLRQGYILAPFPVTIIFFPTKESHAKKSTTVKPAKHCSNSKKRSPNEFTILSGRGVLTLLS